MLQLADAVVVVSAGMQLSVGKAVSESDAL